MNARIGMVPAALAFHFHAHRRVVLPILGLVVVGTAGLHVLGTSRYGVPRASTPLAMAVFVLPFLIMSGSLGREARAGRVALWRFASGGTVGWMLTDLVFRTATVVAAVVLAVLACGGALVVTGAGWQALEAVVASTSFMLALALTLAAPTYGFSALTPRHDAVLAALYTLPASLIITARTVTGELGQHSLLWLFVPIDALASLAPGGALDPGLPPDSHPHARIGGFVLAWFLLGLVAGWVRLTRRMDA